MTCRSLPFAALVLIWLSVPVFADGFIVPTGRDVPMRGTWAVKDHRVRITVDGQHAETEVVQTFVNLTRSTIEAQYLFPIPVGAIIEGFSLVVDGKEIPGKILPAAEAIAIYEAIVRSKRDPGLLTYAGRGLVRANVFPIPAGGSRKVIVRYSELLKKDGDLVRIFYPLDTERFSAKPIEVVSVTVDIRSPAPIKAVYSPSHHLQIERPSETRAIARYREERVLPDRDLLLYYATGAGDVGASLISYFPKGEKAGHFLLLVNPRSELSDEQVIGKNLIVVLDHSGSMRGEKLEQAKEALRYVLNSLSPRDRLNLVAFSSTAQRLFSEPQAVTKEIRDKALAFVNGIQSGGGTDIGSALGLALDNLAKDDSRQNTILFLTDGLPTVGQQDPIQIVKEVAAANREGKGARLFVFGVGYDVNAQFLDRLVEENGGISENVRPGESVEISVTSLYEKIKYTALTDLIVKIDGVEVTDVYPRRLPDLFAGSQLVVAGRYRAGGPASVILGGRVRDGRRAFKFPVKFETASDPDEKPFVARVWATMKIGFLLDQMRVMGRRETELVDEIVRLSMKFGIVTEYTAFLADERTDFRDVAKNRDKAVEELNRKLAESTGGSGTNQAQNVKGMRSRQQADMRNRWRDAQGKEVEVRSVRNVGRKTFYRRGGVWIDREVPEKEEIEEVRQWSPRFFELVRGQKAAENRWLSFEEPVLVRLSGRNVKILPAE